MFLILACFSSERFFHRFHSEMLLKKSCAKGGCNYLQIYGRGIYRVLFYLDGGLDDFLAF